jgi:hypothetical protein
MPRYLVETDLVDATQLDGAEGLAERRFPELSVERRYSTHDGTGVRVIWVCRAPSEAHVDRWAAALRLPAPSVRHIHADR